jgi:hypothetical protein
LGVISRPPAVSVKVTVPRRAPTPAALMELTVASAVAAAALPVAARRTPAIKKLTITIEFERSRIMVPPYDGVTDVEDSSDSVVIVRDGEVLAAIDKTDIRHLIIILDE